MLPERDPHSLPMLEHCESQIQARYRKARPNTPLELTPLRVRKIGAFFKHRIGLSVILIYWWRRN
jgi:hypothetical protein